MATEPPAVPVAQSEADRSTRGGRDRNLWQLPTFLLGVAVVAAAIFGQEFWRPDAATLFRRNLDELRQALNRVPPDLNRVEQLRAEIEAAHEQYRDYDGEVHFLLGSSDLARAEAEPERDTVALWDAARRHLEDAERLGVPPEDTDALRFRLGKVWEQNDSAPPEKVIDYLSSQLAVNNDPSEGYRRLAEAYLRLPVPDLVAARDALKQQLARALHARPEVLTDARLRLSEVLTRLNEHDEARTVLERIRPDSPEAFVASRLQLARSYQADAQWNEAVRILEEARESGSTSRQSELLYELGWSLVQAGSTQDAQQVWQEARTESGPYAAAASLRLAEVTLRGPTPTAAVALLREGVRDADPATEPFLTRLPLTEARVIFEEAIHRYRLVGEFGPAQEIAAAYARIAESGRDQELASETAELWGQELLQQAESDVVNAEQWRAQAAEQFAEAGAGFAALAALRSDPTEQASLMSRSTDLLLKAGQQSNAMEMLERFVNRPDLNDAQRAEIWYQIGESHLAAGNRAGARSAFERVMDHPNAKQSRARLHLARLKIEGNNPREVEAALADLEANLHPESQADAQTREYSLYTLATARYLRREYAVAEQKLTEALDRYPDSELAVQGRYQLGRSCWFLADQEARKAQQVATQIGENTAPDIRESLQQQSNAHERRYRELLAKAATAFTEVQDELLPQLQAGRLLADSVEAVLVRRAAFELGQCRFFLGEFTDALGLFQTLADRYRGEVWELVALSWVSHIETLYSSPPNLENARQARERMRVTFDRMKTEEDAALSRGETPKHFHGRADIHTREHWDNWFREVDTVDSMTPVSGTLP